MLTDFRDNIFGTYGVVAFFQVKGHFTIFHCNLISCHHLIDIFLHSKNVLLLFYFCL